MIMMRMIMMTRWQYGEMATCLPIMMMIVIYIHIIYYHDYDCDISILPPSTPGLPSAPLLQQSPAIITITIGSPYHHHHHQHNDQYHCNHDLNHHHDHLSPGLPGRLSLGSHRPLQLHRQPGVLAEDHHDHQLSTILVIMMIILIKLTERASIL